MQGRGSIKRGCGGELCGIWMICLSYWLLWLFYGRGKSVVRGLIWKEETRAEKPSEVVWWGRVYGGTRVLVKDWGYVSGLWEDCAVGGAYLVREDGARAKKCQEQLVLLNMGS